MLSDLLGTAWRVRIILCKPGFKSFEVEGH
jgi:hypothetical protein